MAYTRFELEYTFCSTGSAMSVGEEVGVKNSSSDSTDLEFDYLEVDPTIQ